MARPGPATGGRAADSRTGAVGWRDRADGRVARYRAADVSDSGSSCDRRQRSYRPAARSSPARHATDPDARSMATSGRGSGVVGDNVQVAVDVEHHLIITHEVTNVGSDRAQLARMAKETKATLERTSLDAIADRGYFSSEEILKCAKADITVTLPKPMTSNPKRFGKQDFRYVAEEDVYICPAAERLAYSFTTQEHGLVLRRYLTNVCQSCTIKHRCTTAKERRITRWEHEHILEAVQRRLDEHPEKMRQRETVEH